MGGSASKTTVNSLSSAITNVAMSTVQSCEVATSQNQNLTVNNSGIRLWGSYNLQQQSEIRSDCFSDINKQAELQNNIINTIAQTTSANNVALLGAFGSSNSEAVSNLTNIIRNNITMSNIQRSYSEIKQNQTASFTNSGVIAFEQVDLTQGAKLFAAATLQEIDKAGVFNAVSNYVDQKSSATMENPLDFIAKALGALGDSAMMSILFIVFLIALAILGFVVIMKVMGGSNDGSDGSDSSYSNYSGALSRLPMPPQMKAATLAASVIR